ncbi:MAG: peptide deformylase [Alphaproteobacteria bacterium]|nr:peptide deformylase [Alphaproteobacteria bacterium]HCP01699.1 peptide deformylase [Rhodospirillaceae bacterium]
MAILKIARMGHPILRTRASEVADPSAPEVARLVDAMVETMEDADGTGLAAPQVHMPWRIVIYKVDDERIEDESGGVPLTVMINPLVEPVGDDTSLGFEACLSVPGMAGAVRRHNNVQVTYQTIEDKKISFDARGFHARVIQHECDHLDGILYPSRIEDMTQFGFVEELSRGQMPIKEGADGD